MQKTITLFLVLIISIALFTACTTKVDSAKELADVEIAIKNSIGWALTKDLNLLYRHIAQDSSLHIINPDSGSTISGFKAFQEVAKNFWLKPQFKATHFEVRNLRITLSQTGTVAWFACFLDDLAEWDGRPIGWHNVRWTGVAEKRDGQWVLAQMHFSYPSNR